MKRRNFVKASVLGAGVLTFTPLTSLFASKNHEAEFASKLNLASLDPKVSKHYANFSEEFFCGLPSDARNQASFKAMVLPKKTVSYDCNAKGYNLTFVNQNGDLVSFIKKDKKAYTLIKSA